MADFSTDVSRVEGTEKLTLFMCVALQAYYNLNHIKKDCTKIVSSQHMIHVSTRHSAAHL